MRWIAARSRNGGDCGEAAMSRNHEIPHLYDHGVIDDRNLRPLAIAFVTILTVWMAVFGLISVSAQIVAQSHNVANGSAQAISTMLN
jgi:hypothetical protein